MQVAAHAPSAERRRFSSKLVRCSRTVTPFVQPAADALDADEADCASGITGELWRRGAMIEVPGSADAPEAAQPEAMPSRRRAGRRRRRGPTGFLERLGWYRDMIGRHARRRRAVVGTAAAPLWACERFHRPFGQGSAPRAVHRDRARAGRPRGGRVSRRPPVWKCCTTLFSCTTTSRTAATRGAARPLCIAASGYPLP